jgi:hypothetical protein
MAIIVSPPADPGDFVSFAPTVIAVGDSPHDRYGIEVMAIGPAPSVGRPGGHVRLRICGPRGGWLYLAGAGALDLSAAGAARLAQDLRTLAHGMSGGPLLVDYDPAVAVDNRYATASDPLRALLAPAGLEIEIHGPLRGNIRSAAVVLARPLALLFAEAIAAAAEVAAGRRPGTLSLL